MKTARPKHSHALSAAQKEAMENLALLDDVSAICKKYGVGPEDAAAIYDEMRAERGDT